MDKTLGQGKVLIAEYFVAVDLLDPKAVLEALVAELDALGHRLDCNAVRSVVHGGEPEVAGGLVAAGHAPEASLLLKALAGWHGDPRRKRRCPHEKCSHARRPGVAAEPPSTAPAFWRLEPARSTPAMTRPGAAGENAGRSSRCEPSAMDALTDHDARDPQSTADRHGSRLVAGRARPPHPCGPGTPDPGPVAGGAGTGVLRLGHASGQRAVSPRRSGASGIANRRSSLFAAALGIGQSPCIEPQADDHRFTNPAWQRQPFALMEQGFLLTEAWWQAATTGLPGVAAAHERIVAFAVRQMLDVASPSNLPWLNPEVIEATVQTGGRNLLDGLANFAADIRHAATARSAWRIPASRSAATSPPRPAASCCAMR